MSPEIITLTERFSRLSLADSPSSWDDKSGRQQLKTVTGVSAAVAIRFSSSSRCAEETDVTLSLQVSDLI